MNTHDLSTDAGLRSASEAFELSNHEWIDALAGTIRWVRGAGQAERATREFQQRLWEDNRVAAVGQGAIPVDRALDDAGFREWLATRSLQPLPVSWDQRRQFMAALYQDAKKALVPFLDKKVPHLKMFRVMAALYPEAMTTVASSGALTKLVRAMGGDADMQPAERHVWVRQRLDGVLGDPGVEPMRLAERMALPWVLYERLVQAPVDRRTEEETTPGLETQLLPLPAARRRRGLTAIRGLFPGLLSALEFIRNGVTREELLDFLRASAPEVKTSSLGVTINAYQSEFDAIRSESGRYVLTERGENVLESQDPSHLADWILTRILGADKALTELRDRQAMSPAELLAAIRTMNPAWSTNFIPQSIVAWYRSMGVIQAAGQNKNVLTDAGRQWAVKIYWEPEPLPAEIDVVPRLAEPVTGETPSEAVVALPTLPAIIEKVQRAGHFPASLVAHLHAGLWSHARRHFAILTGLSGSGKTLLAREYAKALASAESEQRLFTLPVQPGWYDPGALLGFTNPLRSDSYVRTGFLEFLVAASADPGRPYIAVLDEMNLSHPEQYMAPLLSAMETGETILLHTEGDIFDGVPAELPYPNNLVLIGTVNMDETTHGLSDKVLDRAFVLQFWSVDLAAYPHWGTRGIEAKHEERTRDVLTALMEALSPARLHFGWRIVDDVLNYLREASKAGDALPFESALDEVVYAKVLPKVRGEDAPRMRTALNECEQVLRRFGLERSRAKVAELRYDLETIGSARFWR